MSEYMIETHNLTKRYGNQVSVSNLNIHVKKGCTAYRQSVPDKKYADCGSLQFISV